MTLVQKIVDSDQVVVARAAIDVPGLMHVQTAIVGELSEGLRIELARGEFPPLGFEEGDLFLLGRQALGRRWRILSPVTLESIPWLRRLVGLKRTSELNEQDWEERVRRFLPDLNDRNPLISSTAFAEIARAPYSAMRSSREFMDKDDLLAAWQSKGISPERNSLYLLLLGICGDKEVEAWIDEHLSMLDRTHEVDGLAACLVAKLERIGPAGLTELNRKYLSNSQRSEEERQAAYLALSIQGGGNLEVFREPIVAIYREAIESGQTNVLMVHDLQTWSRWELREPIRHLLGKSDLPVSTRDAIQSYLTLAMKVIE